MGSVRTKGSLMFHPQILLAWVLSSAPFSAFYAIYPKQQLAHLSEPPIQLRKAH
jgi:hypothetical protein